MSKMLRWLEVLGQQLESWGEFWEGDSWGAERLVGQAHIMVRNAEELLRQKEVEEEQRKGEVDLRLEGVKARLDKGILFEVEPGDSGKGEDSVDREAE